MSYNNSPVHQHLEGTTTEYECLHLCQEVGGFCGYTIQGGKDTAALISFNEYSIVSPDLKIMRGGTTYFIEVKSREPTRLYNTYGFSTKTLSGYKHLEKMTKINVLLVVRDKTISPLGVKDPNAFMMTTITCDGLFDDAFELGGQTYLKKEHFIPLVNFLTVDRDFGEFLNANDDDEDEDDLEDTDLEVSA